MTTIPTYIPFIRTKTDYKVLLKSSSNVDSVRITADFAELKVIEEPWGLWIDPGFDAFDFIMKNNWYSKKPLGWEKWIRQFNNHTILCDLSTATAAKQHEYDELVTEVLDKIFEYEPVSITVPQLPYNPDSSYHTINRKLAKATGQWRNKVWPDGEFVLPIILNHYDVYSTKTPRQQKINLAHKCLQLSGASVAWTVDQSLDDQRGTSNYATNRFPRLIDFQNELVDILPSDTIHITGPYWALSLILWVRGLSDFVATTSGDPFKYMPWIPLQLITPSKKNYVAIKPLRRRAQVSPELKEWLEAVINKLEEKGREGKQLRQLLKNYDQYRPTVGRLRSKRQQLRFYLNWIDSIEAINPQGRALHLFQEFSSAVITGSQLGIKLPKTEGTIDSRDPGHLAQQFMLQCLPR